MKRKVKIRQAKISDVPRLLEIDKEIWPQFRANGEMFRGRIETFPEGQFVAVVGSKVVGSVFTQLINYEDWKGKTFTWDEVTDSGTILRSHNPNGDSIYGVGLAVAKKFQGTSASRLLIMNSVCWTVQKNKLQILFGARIPGYHKHSDIPVEVYIKTTRKGSNRLLDPELALYQRYEGEPVKPLPDYIEDRESLNFGVLVRWRNPFYNNLFRKIVALGMKMYQVLSIMKGGVRCF